MATALLLAGCSADEPYDGQAEGELVPIRLTSGIEVQSRAHTGMDEQLPAGRGVAFWVDDVATSTQLYGNNTLTTDGSGGFTGRTMYFPRNGNRVNVYGIHTNATLNEAFPTEAVTHTVASDQTAAADYYASDLLYSINREVGPDDPAIQTNFYHLLSKVRIAIAPGTPETDLSGATVQILGTKLSADFTPSKTAILSLARERASIVPASGSVGPITVSNEPSPDLTESNVIYNDAIVIPQDVEAGTPFIRITLSDNLTLEWSPSSRQTLKSGNKHTYHVTVTRTGLDVTSKVVGWWEDRETEPEIQFEANSYMARPNGRAILIPILRANKAANSFYNLGADATGLGGVTADNYTVELVWSDTPVGDGGVIKDMRPYEGEYIYVEPGIEGNAVICIRVGGVIKWSWHIWVTEPVKWKTDPVTGLTWMDRNLGSGGAGSYQSGGKNGLFYQWGRKDAFPGSDGTNNNQTYYTPDYPDGTTAQHNGSYTELYQLAQNPLNFSTNEITYFGSLNVRENNNDSWGHISGTKTIYDPCPPGWKMPPISVNGTNSWGTGGDWGEKANNGRIFNGVNGTAGLNHFYPAAAYRRRSDGSLSTPGNYAFYWSSSSDVIGDSYCLQFSGSLTLVPNGSTYRSNGASVRCVAE